VEAFLDDARCVGCGGRGGADDVRWRKLRSLKGLMKLRVPVRKCTDPDCPLVGQRLGAEVELGFAPPHWTVSWDLFAWMGHRRFSRHWSVPQIRHELADRFFVDVSDDWIEDYLRRYQAIVAGRESDIELLKKEYAGVDDLILTIDGLQPEKGHETLYVIREVRRQRIWFAEPLLCSSNGEIERLFEQAKQIVVTLDKKVRCWMSDKQQAFVTSIAKVFPDVPHRYCKNHFLRDLVKPVMEKDSHAKVQMRRKVRGLRTIEKHMLPETRRQKQAEQKAAPSVGMQPAAQTNAGAGSQPVAAPVAPPADRHEANLEQREAVLDYCACVRGILNDDQGGPLRPPGVRMDDALAEVQQSVERVLSPRKGRREAAKSPEGQPDRPHV
jgi:hypothetical protein